MLASSNGRPWRMSALMSIPRPCFMSELIQPAGVQPPQPQLSLFTFVCIAVAICRLLKSLITVCTNFSQHCRENFPGIKIVFSQLASGTRMPIVIGNDFAGAGNCFVERSKREQAVADREMLTKSGVLNQSRFAR